jgi:7,8-dihydro-6-hydroxymethylpterin dimethyltransferase
VERIHIHSTVSYCPHCKTSQIANVFYEDNHVYMKRLCPEHTSTPVIISSDYSWYMERITRAHEVSKPSEIKPISKGCPFDCGLCAQHSNTVHLPVFSITNDCNLDCPICFTYNRPDKKYYKRLDEVKQIVDVIRKNRPVIDVINLTGGEPTLHPDFFKIIAYLKSCGIQRTTVNTNGIRIANDEEFAVKIKESGAQMVLSLNTFDSEKSVKLHGRDISEEKRTALHYFEKYSIPLTILCVAVKNFNEDDLAEIINEYFSKSFVKNIVIQNMTFTGAHGNTFAPREHITVDEVESFLSKTNVFSRNDFFPLGSSHPLCYSVAYYFIENETKLSLSKLIDKERLIEMTSKGYLIEPDNDFSKDFLEGINTLWAKGESEENIAVLRSFFKKMYPADKKLSDAERLSVAGQSIKSIYIHSHMDDDTSDLARLSRCGDIVPDESGAMVPACSYNLLYRESDERFWYK